MGNAIAMLRFTTQAYRQLMDNHYTIDLYFVFCRIVYQRNGIDNVDLDLLVLIFR